jgi:hypothetical protein
VQEFEGRLSGIATFLELRRGKSSLFFAETILSPFLGGWRFGFVLDVG